MMTLTLESIPARGGRGRSDHSQLSDGGVSPTQVPVRRTRAVQLPAHLWSHPLTGGHDGRRPGLHPGAEHRLYTG